MPPALDPPVVDLQVTAGLAAPAADPSPAPETDSHDHPPSEPKLTSMTDAPGKRRSRLNAVVTRTSPSLRAA